MLAWFEKLKADFVLNFVKANRWKFLLEGLGNTLIITVVALLIGVALGVIIAGVRSTYDKTQETARRTVGRRLFGIANWFCKVYLTVLRGTPVVVQLMIIYFVIFVKSNNGVMVAALAFGLNSGLCCGDIPRRHHVHRQRPVRGRPQPWLQLFADDALRGHPAGHQKCPALAGQ